MEVDEDFVSETRNVPWVYILLRIENFEVISILRKIWLTPHAMAIVHIKIYFREVLHSFVSMFGGIICNQKNRNKTRNTTVELSQITGLIIYLITREAKILCDC